MKNAPAAPPRKPNSGPRKRAAIRAEKLAQQEATQAAVDEVAPVLQSEPPPRRSRRSAPPEEPPIVDTPPWEEPAPVPEAEIHDIPIKELEPPAPEQETATPAPAAAAVRTTPKPVAASVGHLWKLPPMTLLNEPPGRNPYDSQELKEIAARIKSKFQEFNVLGTVVQINPGPVVTTFEFQPEAGVKYSRITTLSEDLCLGLQAESILIERIPGKPTVGIEVPNTKREVISLREVSRVGRVPEFAIAAHRSARQRYQRAHQGDRTRDHAPPVDRGLHRIR